MDDSTTIESERAARKAALDVERKRQRAIDLEALNALEIEHGDENVAAVKVERYSPGLVTLIVVRALTRPEFKRFQARLKAKPGEAPDNAAATEEAGLSALIYPKLSSEEWKALDRAIPGMAVRAGSAASELTAGLEVSAGKV
jgi:hypothetical protein